MFVHRHVMNELLETERAYVEELMCVLQVSKYQFILLYHFLHAGVLNVMLRAIY